MVAINLRNYTPGQLNVGVAANPQAASKYTKTELAKIQNALQLSGQNVTALQAQITANNNALGTAAFQNIGTSGATVPLLNTACTWLGNQTITGTLGVSSTLTLSGYGAGFLKTNVSGVVSANALSPPQVSVVPSGSGTYTTPAGALYLVVELIGAGAGGAGSGTSAGNGTSGGNTTFSGTGISLTASGGSCNGSVATGAVGGTASGGDLNVAGGNSGGSQFINSAPGSDGLGGHGGASLYGGGGGAAASGNAGENGSAWGSGGSGGGGATSNNWSGSGGSAGGYVRKLITSPVATYSYAVGGAGSGGAAGTGGFAGGSGQTGYLIVTAYFQ